MISEATLQKVRDVPIEEVLRPYVSLQKKGASLMGLCPFHGERTGSFSVSPAKNLFHCFSCGRGGDSIAFIMEKESLSFMEAVRFIAQRHGVPIEYVQEEQGERSEQQAEYRHREKLLTALELIQSYFVQCLADPDSLESRQARAYAYGRWPEAFCGMTGIGYAPSEGRCFLAYCQSKQITEETLFELGMLRQSEGQRPYVLFRDRLMIPIRNRWGRVIAYTARALANNTNIPKYINSTTSPVYAKGETLFGINRAVRCRQASFFIIVEGAPDVLRLQSVGLENTVAALGTSWTDNQFDRLKKLTDAVCFVPDSDVAEGNTFGAGVQAVMKNGALAVRKGFRVTVRELPFLREEVVNEATGEVTSVPVKTDADSFIRSLQDFLSLRERHFPVWLAEKRFHVAQSMEDERQVVAELAALLRSVEDPLIMDQCLQELSAIHGKVKLWRDAVSRARGEARRNKEGKKNSDVKPREADQLRQQGLFVCDNCYYSIGEKKEEDPVCLSNFVMEPLFHIVDENNGTRLFNLRNSEDYCRVVEFKESDLCSLTGFQQKIGSVGNYVWLSRIDKLNRVKICLYARTDTAERIRKLGWNEPNGQNSSEQNGFFAFGNGIFFQKEFHEVDELGIVRGVNGKAYYLPATSGIYSGNPEIFQFERLMVHEGTCGISLYEYVKLLHTVYGKNADIAFCYLLSTLFRDLIFRRTRHFPILNLFGEKGTGKTTLATCLQAFFLHGVDPPNLGVTSIPAMNDRVSQAVNTLTVLDEYKNDLDIRKIAFLKGLWGGGGQTKKNVHTDGLASQTIVTTGVAFCGQDKPTQDMALYTRVLFLAFSKTSFSSQEKRNYEKLVSVCNMGLTHLAIEVLNHREHFEKLFSGVYSTVKSELAQKLEGEEIHDRIFGNWVIPLAAFRTLETVIRVPITYPALFEIALEGIREQNSLAQESSEVSDFWNMLQGFQTAGKCVEKAHYRIRYQRSFQSTSAQTKLEFGDPRPVLYLNMPAVCNLLSSRSPGSAASRSGWSTILSYLKSHSSYLGLRQDRFMLLLPNGLPDYTVEVIGGRQVQKVKMSRPNALCFDYQVLKDLFGLDLETVVLSEVEEALEEREAAGNGSGDRVTPGDSGADGCPF